MKKVSVIFFMLMAFIVLVGCAEEELSFDIPNSDEALLGEIYEITPMVAVDSKGKEYIASVEVELNGENVVVTNNKFEITSLGTYNVNYTFNYNGKVYKETLDLIVKDGGKPQIIVVDYQDSVMLGDVVTIPVIRVTDNSNETIIPTVKVFYKDTTEEVVISNDNTFTAGKTGYYTIEIKAKDSSNNSSVKNLVVLVRKTNEIEGFNNEQFLLAPGNVGTPNNAQISFNTDLKYILEGTGSLKFTSTSEMAKGSYPEFTLENPAIKDVSGYQGVSFFVYNANKEKSRVNVSNRSEGWFELAPLQWTEIVIAKEKYNDILPGEDFSGIITASSTDLSGLRIYFEKTSDDEQVFYIDSFRALDELDDVTIEKVSNSEGNVLLNTTLEINILPNIQDLDYAMLSVNVISLNSGLKTAINGDKTNYKFDVSGKYVIEYIFTNYDDKIAVYYDELFVEEPVINPYLTVEDFELNSDLIFSSNNQTSLSVNTDKTFILTGESNLRASIDGNDGYPFINVSKNRWLTNIDMYDYVILNIYNSGSKSHEMHINAINVANLEPGQNVIKLSKAKFEEIMNNDEVANGLDSYVYGLNKTTFFIFNDGARNEAFSLYFDSVVGGFNDRDVVNGTEVNLDELLNNGNLSNFVLTNGLDTITVVDNKFTVSLESDYLLTFTASKEGFSDQQVTINLNVEIPIVEINGNYLDFETDGELDKIDQREASLTINNDLNFVETGKSSLKFYTTGGYPELILLKEHILKLNEFDFFYINVFNDGQNEHDGYIATEVGNYHRFKLKAKQWNVIRLTNEELVAALNNSENNGNLRMIILNEIGVSYEELNLYFDNIHFANTNELPAGSVFNLDVVDGIVANEATMSVSNDLKYVMFGDNSLKLSLTGGYPSFKFSNSYINQHLENYSFFKVQLYSTGDNHHDGYFTLADGNYKRFVLKPKQWLDIVLSKDDLLTAMGYDSQDLNLNIMNDGGSHEQFTVYLASFYGFNTNSLTGNEIVSFEDSADLNHFSHRNSTLEINANLSYVLSGNQSLKLNTGDGYPQLKVANSILSSNLSSFDYFTIDIYNDGNNNHGGYLTISSGNYKRFTLVSKKWSTIVLSRADLELALSDESNLEYLIFDIANDGGSHENLTIYLDSITGHIFK